MPSDLPFHRTLEIRDFTCFHEAKFEFGPGINVFVGENGTGKTHALKLLYALQRRQSEDLNVLKSFEGAFNISDATKLVRRGEEVALLYGVHGATQWLALLEDVKSEKRLDEIKRQIASNEHYREKGGFEDAKWFALSAVTQEMWVNVGRPVFLPTQDILGHYRRFVSLYDTYKIDFDSTYRDLATLLGAPERRELSEYQREMLGIIRGLIGGEFTQKGEGFVLDNGQGEYEAAMIGEGHRKLGALAMLIRNGMLEPGGALFWDEPEANVNPTSMDEIVTVLLTLARHGVQIFLSTHSYVILKELDLQATMEDGVRYFAFGKSDDGTQVTMATDFTELKPNPILDQYDSLFARDIEKSLQETAL